MIAMTAFRRLLAKTRGLFGNRERNSDFDTEMADHLNLLTDRYIRQGMKFFVAKVNLKEQQKLGFNYLRPIQVAFEFSRCSLEAIHSAPARMRMKDGTTPSSIVR